jgi:hypothetical protein
VARRLDGGGQGGVVAQHQQPLAAGGIGAHHLGPGGGGGGGGGRGGRCAAGRGKRKCEAARGTPLIQICPWSLSPAFRPAPGASAGRGHSCRAPFCPGSCRDGTQTHMQHPAPLQNTSPDHPLG